MKDSEYQTFSSEVIGKPPLLYTEQKFSLSYIRCIFVMEKNKMNMPIKGSCQIFTAPAKDMSTNTTLLIGTNLFDWVMTGSLLYES